MDQVFIRLEENGLRANKEKCTFQTDSVEYCGDIIAEDGLRQSPKKEDAIVDMPVPEEVSQICSFLGMVQYYACFLPDLSTHLNPLHRLLTKDQKWSWGPKEEKSFQKVKKMLADNHVLIHFDPDLPVLVASDSSSYG